MSIANLNFSLLPLLRNHRKQAMENDVTYHEIPLYGATEPYLYNMKKVYPLIETERITKSSVAEAGSEHANLPFT